MTSTEATDSASARAANAKLSVRSEWSHSDRIKRESRHIFNKLHSIAGDAAFVRQVHRRYPTLLLTANLRCGAWYTDPAITSAVSYFKSTDGHTHQWSFSLKRSNLHIVPAILQSGGAIIVDSTRRGKSMPDALSKTVPVWCAVLNAASNSKYGVPARSEAFTLHTPTWMIPPSEHDQIQARIDGFVELLLNSDLQVPRLEKPLKPIFVTPQTNLEALPASLAEPHTADFVPVVLLSASRFVADSAKLNTSEADDKDADVDKFVYVQGAGDDHENWARGLTPDLFWQHQKALLACEKERLENMVDELVKSLSASGASSSHWFTPSHGRDTAAAANGSPIQIPGTAEGDVEVGGTGVFIGTRTAEHSFSPEEQQIYQLIVHFTSLAPPTEAAELSTGLAALEVSTRDTATAKVYPLHLSPNKKGLLAIRSAFAPAVELAYRTLTNPRTTAAGRQKVLVCCQDGKDLSGSLVVAILASCFTDLRQLITDDEHRRIHLDALSKDTTQRRLQWLVSANPRAAPSRAFLLRVNELLLSHKHRPASK